MSRKKEEFKPISKVVGIYTCGPTVYSRAHIGNLRAYIFEDVLVRVLLLNEFKIKRVMNITDVGHLTSDADSGEDKMEKGAAKEKMTAVELAEKYTELFKSDIKRLNILEPDIWCKATDHIQEQIDLVKKLIDKNYTYETEDGIYFDTSKLKDYGKLARLDIEGLEEGKRVDVKGKKNKTDFALWKFSNEKRQMEWDAFGKKGFPGWHIECSAMSMTYLGETFDIHCGGIDHVPIHHTNEIAQAEAATGKEFVKYWMHNEFLVMDNSKMAKSIGNVHNLDDVDPLSYRYFCLNTHYRKQLMFSLEGLEAAENALERLKGKIKVLIEEDNDGGDASVYVNNFKDAVSDDLNVPKALGIMWEMLDDEKISNSSKLDAILKFDSVFGLNLDKVEAAKSEKVSGIIVKWDCEVNPAVMEIVIEREQARHSKDFKKSDELRDKIVSLGYEIKDKKEGPEIRKK